MTESHTNTKTRTESAREVAAADGVRGERAALQAWQERLAAAEGELAALEAQPGDELLDPARAAEWPKRLRELRDQITAASRAVEAQGLRVASAERAWCQVQADLLAKDEVAPAAKALRVHEARTKELLNALKEHDGDYVPALELFNAQYQVGDRGKNVPTQKVHALRFAVRRAEVRHAVLAAMASGADVDAVVQGRGHGLTEDECYPEQVQAGGLVPAGAFVRRIAAARALVEELEALPAELEADLDRLDDQALREQWDSRTLQAARSRRFGRLEEVPDELAAARRILDELTGHPAQVEDESAA